MASYSSTSIHVELALLVNLFLPRNLGELSSLNPTKILPNIPESYSPHASHDEDDPSKQMSNKELTKLDKEPTCLNNLRVENTWLKR